MQHKVLKILKTEKFVRQDNSSHQTRHPIYPPIHTNTDTHTRIHTQEHGRTVSVQVRKTLPLGGVTAYRECCHRGPPCLHSLPILKQAICVSRMCACSSSFSAETRLIFKAFVSVSNNSATEADAANLECKDLPCFHRFTGLRVGSLLSDRPDKSV